MAIAVPNEATDLGGLIDHLSAALRNDSPAGEARAVELWEDPSTPPPNDLSA